MSYRWEGEWKIEDKLGFAWHEKSDYSSLGGVVRLARRKWIVWPAGVACRMQYHDEVLRLEEAKNKLGDNLAFFPTRRSAMMAYMLEKPTGRD